MLINALRKDLNSKISFEIEQPFRVRKFDPYLNGKWIGNADSYGCYRAGQAPDSSGPTKSEILEDLKILTDYWNLIRVYNADNDTENILEVIRENNLPLKMMLGVWLEDEDDDSDSKKVNIENVLHGIELANAYSDIVKAVNVGNETQVYWSAHKMNQKDLIRYIRVGQKK